MESHNPKIDDDRFAAALEQMPPDTKEFYASLQETPCGAQYKALFLRYAARQGTASDVLRMAVFNLHHLAFVIRRKISGCLLK